MSLSDQNQSVPNASVQPVPWALDEFASNEIFPSFPFDGPSADAADSYGNPGDGEHEGTETSGAPDIDAAIAAAYARGIADGESAAYNKASEEADEKIVSLIAALHDALESVRLHEARWISNAQENVAALAVGIARHIVQHEVTADAATIQQLVQRAVGLFPLEQTLEIRLHPDDHSVCASLDGGGVHKLRFTSDQSIQRGGCLVEGRERIIDGRVDTALERLYRTIGQIHS